MSGQWTELGLSRFGIHTDVVMGFTVWMEHLILTDAPWAKMRPLCLGKPTDPGRTGGDDRLLLDAVLWIARSGAPWRDLPPILGN